MRMRSSPPKATPAALALGLALLGCSLLAPAGASASRGQWSVFEDRVGLIPVSPSKRQRTLEEIKRLGPDTLRIEIRWNDVAPNPRSKKRPNFNASDPNAYATDINSYPGFGIYDDLVRRAHALGFRILMTITGDAPRWATQGGRGASFATANWKPSPTEYGRFAEAVARRYSGKVAGLPAVRYFTIWNEPNHRQFLKPRSAAPRLYRNMVNAALPAIRAHGVRGAKIFVGELAPVGRAPKATGPTQFLRKWLCLNKRFRRTSKGAGCRRFKKVKANGFAHHPYGPVQRVPKKLDVINMLAIRKLGKYLNLAGRAGRIKKGIAIYDTEFGLQSNPPDRTVSTTPSRQARLINEKEEYAWRYPRLKSHCQYLLRDDPPRRGPRSEKWAGFQTGLRFPSGRRKPAYNAYKFPIVVHRRRSGVLIWGLVRPGSGVRSVRIERRKGSRWVTVKKRKRTNGRGYFTLRLRGVATYRFRAYDGPGRKAKRIGRSRGAAPR